MGLSNCRNCEHFTGIPGGCDYGLLYFEMFFQALKAEKVDALSKSSDFDPCRRFERHEMAVPIKASLEMSLRDWDVLLFDTVLVPDGIRTKLRSQIFPHGRPGEKKSDWVADIKREFGIDVIIIDATGENNGESN